MCSSDLAGYKAVLIAANMSKRFFPMLTTAAGTIRPAKVLIIGAGVAGLQAIATARRLGAIVEAYDVRRAAGGQVKSLGAKFLQGDMDAGVGRAWEGEAGGWRGRGGMGHGGDGRWPGCRQNHKLCAAQADRVDHLSMF